LVGGRAISRLCGEQVDIVDHRAGISSTRISTLLVDFYGSGGSSGAGTTIGVKEADNVAGRRSIKFLH